MIAIGCATQDELPQMVDLLAALFALEGDFQPETDKQLRGLRLILENPEIGQLFVIRDGASVVGMANALITVSTAEGGRVVLLEDVIVSRPCRGKGLGRRLVEHVFEWAREQGISRVTLLADRENQSALNFYRNLGFEPSYMTVLRKKL